MNPYSIGLQEAANGRIFSSDSCRVVPQTGSTMDDVRDEIAKGNTRDGFTIIALQQNKGRGGGLDAAAGKPRQWWSGEGNLMFSRIIDAGIPVPKEIDFVSTLAVARQIALLLPRATVAYKFANDILVDGGKICGSLFLEHPQPAGAKRVANLGIGVNLAATPPSSAIRRGTAVTRATCLKDHGVMIGIDEFLASFDKEFAALRRYHREAGFTAVLQMIGFADDAGIVTLRANKDGTVVKGGYAGFSGEEITPAVYRNAIHLKTAQGDIVPFSFNDYNAIATIVAPGVGQTKHRMISSAPHA